VPVLLLCISDVGEGTEKTARDFPASPAPGLGSAGTSWERPESEFAQAKSLSG
jgi:hypothetical protein